MKQIRDTTRRTVDSMPQALLGVTALLGSFPVLAAGADSVGIEEVVVTAQRWESTLERTPISIVALTAADVDSARIQENQDLQLLVPNLIAAGGGQNGQRVWIRGIGPNVSGSGTEANVASYRDGVYLARAFSAEVPLLDVDRIEVLRGPQGTLYGRNATGGSINVISKEPTDQFSLGASAELAEFSKRLFTATLNAPFSDDVYGRLSVSNANEDSYMRNVIGAGSDERNDYWQGKGALKINAGEALSITLRGDFLDAQQLNFVPTKMTVVENLPTTLFGNVDFSLLNLFAPGSEPPRVIPRPAVPAGAFDYASGLRTEPFKKHREYSGSAQLSYEFSGGTFASLTAFRDMEVGFEIDANGSASTFGVTPGAEDARQWFQEFLFSGGEQGRLRWVAGANYFHEQAQSVNGAPSSNAFYSDLYPLLGFTLIYREGHVSTDAAAAFGQVSYSLADAVALTAGGRYSWESKEASLIKERDTTTLGGLVPGTQTAGTTRWSNFSPKVGIEYTPSADMLLYASATQGFKSGGYNTADDQRPFDEEQVTSYEIGAKGAFLDRRVQLGGAVFYMDYEDLQVQQRAAQGSVFRSIITNAASSTIKGIELDLTVKPAAPLTLKASVGLLDGEFDDFRTNLPLDPPGTPPTNLAGRELPNAPRFTSTLTMLFTHPLQLGRLGLRVDYRRQSEVFLGATNAAFERQPDYGILNATLDFVTVDERFTLGFTGQNLTDELIKTSALQVVGFGLVETFARPRTLGVFASYNWR